MNFEEVQIVITVMQLLKKKYYLHSVKALNFPNETSLPFRRESLSLCSPALAKLLVSNV